MWWQSQFGYYLGASEFMPITKAIVTHDMNPEVYKIWKKLAELHGMDMDKYFEYLIKDQTYEASVMRYFHKRK
jgi:hypothetical protein